MRFLFVLTILLALTGCGGEFTRKNFDMIRISADTRDTVREKLGNPSSDMGGDETWYYEHPDRHDGAVIQFDEETGRVTGKQWHDSVSGEHGIETPTLWKEIGGK